MTFDEAFDLMGQDEAFRATVYAMNTLLIAKGFYSSEEFQELFIDHAINFKNGFRGRSQTEVPSPHETVPSNP
jgi:hypothetical protein